MLHAYNLFVTVRHHEVPWVPVGERVQVQPLGHDCWQLTLDYGFKDDPDVPAALELLRTHGVPLDPMDTSYFLSRDIVVPSVARDMSLWREKLFVAMHRNAARAADFLSLPPNRVVELGAKITL